MFQILDTNEYPFCKLICRLQILCPQAYSLCKILLYWSESEILFILEIFSNVFECIDNILFWLWLLHLQKYIDEKFSPDEKLPWVKHFLGKGFAGKHCKIPLSPTQICTSPLNQRKEKRRQYMSNWKLKIFLINPNIVFVLPIFFWL